MRKKLFALLFGLALLSFGLVLAGCTEDSNGGGCGCRSDAGEKPYAIATRQDLSAP